MRERHGIARAQLCSTVQAVTDLNTISIRNTAGAEDESHRVVPAQASTTAVVRISGPAASMPVCLLE